MYGIRTTEDPERTVWADDIEEYFRIEKGDLYGRERLTEQYGNERYPFEPFSLFSHLGLYCYVFDICPSKGVETYVNLNNPLDPSFYNQFDILLDWGVSEHVFNIGEQFKNCFRLVKPSVNGTSRGGGVVLHMIPWEPSAGNFYRIDSSAYRIDPGILRDFYLYNECAILDAALYSSNKREPIRLQPIDSAVEFVENSNKEELTMMYFVAQKTVDVPEIRIPIQRQYDDSLSHIYTWSPFLYDKNPRKADQSLSKPITTLHPNQSFYDGMVRNLRNICSQEEADALLAEKDYLDDPEPLQDRIEEILKKRAWEHFEETVIGLKDKELYFRIADLDLYEKRKDMFTATSPKAIVSSDTLSAIPGMTYDNLPIVSFAAIKENPHIPVVVFSGRRKIKTVCRELRKLSYPWPRLHLIPCWQ